MELWVERHNLSTSPESALSPLLVSSFPTNLYSVTLALQYLLKDMYGMIEVVVPASQAVDGSHRVQDRGMVAATKGGADCRIA